MNGIKGRNQIRLDFERIKYMNGKDKIIEANLKERLLKLDKRQFKYSTGYSYTIGLNTSFSSANEIFLICDMS